MSNFVDNDHALQTGMLIGTLRGAKVAVKPTLDQHGDYTSVLAIEILLDGATGTYRNIYIRVLASGE